MERSFYMERLPYIDEHVMTTGAPPSEAWDAMLGVVRREFGGHARVARLLGCEPAAATATFAGRPGDTVPGFRVVDAEPQRRLTLEGRHRFSRYRLTLTLDGQELRARTDAAFPGLLGRLYRAAVIGTGGHRFATRRLLAQVVRRA
jgi:Protein of unknown function (DUF2867)